jgi:hypothetical protein
MPESKKTGIGLISQMGNLVFPRVFRFTLKSDRQDNLVHYVTKAHFNLKLNILTVIAYEAVLMEDKAVNPALDYLTSMLDNSLDSFTLTTYDGCGHSLTEHRFLNAKLVDHDTFFDYAPSDVVAHTMVFNFEKCETTNKAHLPSDPIPMGSFGSPKFTVRKTSDS